MTSPLSSLDLSKLKVSELKQRLRDAGLPISGKKSELITRLTASMKNDDSSNDHGKLTYVSPDPSDNDDEVIHDNQASEEKELESTSSSITPPKNRGFGKTKRKLSAMLSEESADADTTNNNKRRKKTDDLLSVSSHDLDSDEKSEEETTIGGAPSSSSSSSSSMLKIVCYNVNGVRAAKKHGLEEYLNREDGDFVCLSEMKAEESQNPLTSVSQYKHVYWNASKSKKGYAGTCILSKQPALNIEYNVGYKPSDSEGRMICLEFDSFYLINTYVPNSGDKLKFKVHRQAWDQRMYDFLDQKQKQMKPVIWTGDLNVAVRDFDVYDGETNANREKTAGFTPYERSHLRSLLDGLDMVDSYAHLYPERRKKELFTFYSKRGKNLKSDGKGWRLDYFIVSRSIIPLIKDVIIRRDEECSDHVPLVMNFTQP